MSRQLIYCVQAQGKNNECVRNISHPLPPLGEPVSKFRPFSYEVWRSFRLPASKFTTPFLLLLIPFIHLILNIEEDCTWEFVRLGVEHKRQLCDSGPDYFNTRKIAALPAYRMRILIRFGHWSVTSMPFENSRAA